MLAHNPTDLEETVAIVTWWPHSHLTTDNDPSKTDTSKSGGPHVTRPSVIMMPVVGLELSIADSYLRLSLRLIPFRSTEPF